MRRRRPLLGAAMIGGTAYVAGKRNMEGQQREADEQARIADLEAQVQAQQAPAAAAPAAAPAGDDIASQAHPAQGPDGPGRSLARRVRGRQEQAARGLTAGRTGKGLTWHWDRCSCW